MADNLTIGALLAKGSTRLRDAERAVATPDPLTMRPASTTPDLDAEILLAHVLSMTRTQLRAHPEAIQSSDRANRYAELIERRAAGEPVAYIVGYRDFWTLRLIVNSTVLVPRPETELLVERALAQGPAGHARIADLGTGSGAIALALASERPAWSVTATDLSESALATARSNASTLGLNRVEFVLGKWFEPLAGRQFDLIVSNPPYVAGDDPALMDLTLKHEPRIALTPGTDGISSLRAIIHSAPQYLQRHGWLLLEHGSDQAAAVAHELVVRGFGHVRSHPDLAGHLRVTEAQWN
jgi:release factor glutamine methyltransferase